MSQAARGRTHLAPRAIKRLAQAVASKELGVSSNQANVVLGDDAGRLGLTVTAPIPLSPLSSPVGRPSESTVLERVSVAGQGIRDELQRLSGLLVGRVDISITGVAVRVSESPRWRVR